MRNQRYLPFGALILVAAIAMLSGERSALAQEAINTPAATQPGEGNFVNTYKLRFTRYQDTPAGSSGSANEVRLEALLAYGLSGNWSVSVQAPLTARTVSDEPTLDSDAGLGDLTLQFKHRFWQNDFGAVDTARASVFFGAELPTGNSGFGSGSVDPFAGVVLTYISGRHGFNQAVSWKLNTGGADDVWRAGDSKHDLLRFDTAYLYRLSPREYGADFVASTYAVVELNGFYETNGDTELFIAPGLLYEAPTFALELSVSIPVHQSLDNRPEAQYSVGVGVRFLF
jgi:hypothetical protein